MAMLRKSEHFWPLLWGGAALVLVLVLVLEHQFGGSSAGQGPRAPPKVAEAKLLPAFHLPPELQSGAETLARPLFVPGRRPSPPALAGPGTMKRGQFVLQGTTLVGSLQIALLKEISSGAIHRVEKGGQILGMTLAEITPEQVVLRSGDDSETLPLVVAKGAGSPAAAVEHGPFGSATPSAAPPAAQNRPAAAAPVPARRAAPLVRPPPSATFRSGVGASVPKQNLPVPGTTAGDPDLTPEEMISRRRAARRSQPQN